jgi:hypothetical protein
MPRISSNDTIAKEIILAHGGDLTAINDQIGGAMFTIELLCQPNMDEFFYNLTNIAINFREPILLVKIFFILK